MSNHIQNVNKPPTTPQNKQEHPIPRPAPTFRPFSTREHRRRRGTVLWGQRSQAVVRIIGVIADSSFVTIIMMILIIMIIIAREP